MNKKEVMHEIERRVGVSNMKFHKKQRKNTARKRFRKKKKQPCKFQTKKIDKDVNIKQRKEEEEGRNEGFVIPRKWEFAIFSQQEKNKFNEHIVGHFKYAKKRNHLWVHNKKNREKVVLDKIMIVSQEKVEERAKELLIRRIANKKNKVIYN